MHTELIGKTEFTFREADHSQALMEAIYRLRYQVYCVECGFIRKEDYPKQSEEDIYDPYSVHFVIEDTVGVVGTTRLILDNPHGLPFIEHCGSGLSIDVGSLDREKICEVSRLAISKSYRRRENDGLYYGYEGYDPSNKVSGIEQAKRIKPMIFGMYREIYQECKRRGITHFFALMEKSLWLLLRMHHFVFQPIGNEVDFYGKVRPYMCVIKDLEREVHDKMPKSYDYFLNSLEEKYYPKF